MIGLLVKRFYNVIFKILDLVAIWILVFFGLNLAISLIKHISFEELSSNL